jgi:transcriptional regulator with PAS, ATPase and Fis domain
VFLIVDLPLLILDTTDPPHCKRRFLRNPRVVSRSRQTSAGIESPALIGASAVMVAVRAAIATAARTDAKVLVLGETGVGKEVVARLIHERSRRATREFVAVNCSGIPETLLESELFGHVRGSFTGAYRDKPGLLRRADRGTLFLDELGEMSLRMQAALLRFSETGEIQPVGADAPSGPTDVRLICATHRDLQGHIADGTFREDLYYRLNVIQIVMPPLRDRGDDILLLLQHFLTHVAVAHQVAAPTLTPDAAQLLLAYAWPGNVRELRNVTERLVLQQDGRPVRPDDLPLEVCGEVTPRRAARGAAAAVSSVATPEGVGGASPIADELWARLCAGEDFWTVVHEAFKARAITRADLAAVIDRGLRETHGSYRALLARVNLPPTDYKRFHGFLSTQHCNLPVGRYRHKRRA